MSATASRTGRQERAMRCRVERFQGTSEGVADLRFRIPAGHRLRVFWLCWHRGWLRICRPVPKDSRRRMRTKSAHQTAKTRCVACTPLPVPRGTLPVPFPVPAKLGTRDRALSSISEDQVNVRTVQRPVGKLPDSAEALDREAGQRAQESAAN